MGRLVRDVTGRDAGAIDWLSPANYELQRRLSDHRTDRDVSFTNEGMPLRNGTLHLLPEDDPSR